MELSQLFGSQRMSSIPVGLYVKFEVSQENIQKAELARQEREERDRVREERRLRLAQQIAERKARVIGRNEQAKIDLRNSLFPCLVEIDRSPQQCFVSAAIWTAPRRAAFANQPREPTIRNQTQSRVRLQASARSRSSHARRAASRPGLERGLRPKGPMPGPQPNGPGPFLATPRPVARLAHDDNRWAGAARCIGGA